MRRSIATLCVALATTATAGAYGAYPQLAVPDFAAPMEPSAAADGWSKAANVKLGWDVVHVRPSTEATAAYISTDGKALYVRFDAQQREAIAAAQHTDDVVLSGDDYVWIDVWPAGQGGYMYQFQANPNGAHYETSSENTSYSPSWESHGSVHDGGYTVTMRIPLEVMRGVGSSHSWKAQFVRSIHATGEQQVWSYDSAQNNVDDYARAGILTMPQLSVTPSRPKPRLAAYYLAAAASKSIGGSTSRVGADLSIPVTPTASFYATFHPDYSNVELDQQTISPTVYARYYSEVRPFFTQGASFYNQFNCDACPNIQTLYTPAIPTPREGYAVEGKQGPISVAAFDSIGDGRSDIASAVTYVSPDTRWQATAQRVAVDDGTLSDTTSATGIAYYDLKHTSAYFNYGTDSGTNVLQGNQAQWYDFGGGWANSTFGFFGSVRKIGEYFNPVDGFISHPGIAGYALYSAKLWDFAPSSKIQTVGLAGFIDRYQGPTQGQAQSDNSLLLDVLTKSAWDVQLFSGSNYWRFGDVLTPVSQNAGFQITYHSGLQTNNPGQFPFHGSSAYPTSVNFSTGHYGDGTLDTWFRTSTIRVGNRGALTLALDDTAQYLPHAPNNVQWFESVSYAYQVNSSSSFAIGVRTVIGYPPNPNGGGNCEGRCSNVSVAYHLRLRHSEIYAAYGNPNTLDTVPQMLFKLIFYAGAEKGT